MTTENPVETSIASSADIPALLGLMGVSAVFFYFAVIAIWFCFNRERCRAVYERSTDFLMAYVTFFSGAVFLANMYCAWFGCTGDFLTKIDFAENKSFFVLGGVLVFVNGVSQLFKITFLKPPLRKP